MTEATFVSSSPEETRALGERVGRALEAGDVIVLSGELGAGKTVFVQGLARGLGFEGRVSSKSFVLMGEYAGRIKLYHADLYRLDEPEMAEDLGLGEVTADGALVVEWPERAEYVVPPDALRGRFEVVDAGTRRLHFSAADGRAERLLRALTEEG
jgi:tRNA threonylcarbamoyladenosine biosynthesis protein TsaE